jgi:hypothetical protein
LKIGGKKKSETENTESIKKIKTEESKDEESRDKEIQNQTK